MVFPGQRFKFQRNFNNCYVIKVYGRLDVQAKDGRHKTIRKQTDGSTSAILARDCILTKYARRSIFSQIVSVTDLINVKHSKFYCLFLVTALKRLYLKASFSETSKCRHNKVCRRTSVKSSKASDLLTNFEIKVLEFHTCYCSHVTGLETVILLAYVFMLTWVDRPSNFC